MRMGVKTSTSLREDLSFDPSHIGQSPTTPAQHEKTSPCRYKCHIITCHQLVFISSDDETPVRPQHSNTDTSSPGHRSAGLSSQEHCNQHHMYTQHQEQFYIDFEDVAWDNDTTSTGERFPIAPLG